MIIHARLAAIKGIKPHEWIIRFVFGGAVCVVAGLIAQKFGPVIGGFFLAFPAIFTASASLVEAHEKQHKARAGFDGSNRGRIVAAIDARGAAMGCIGLAGFAFIFWIWMPRTGMIQTFVLATLVWLTLAVGVWLVYRRRLFRRLQGRNSATHTR
ncbi:DUF3147 family protein [Telmatobacter sp. DSM 110680]|uniref:DUF3147 family protein n=1 Tax=Telmatobacter sp. DSM 110680 TaxID=3036704 RepID=A0AAU7DQ79_9BACT